MRTVVIYRDELLPISETFIKAQASSLRRYRPQFVGVFRSKESLTGLDDAIIAVPPSRAPLERMRRTLYYRTGYAPEFHRAIRNIGASIVHAHFATSGKNALNLSDRFKMPLIVTLHGHDITVEQDYQRLYSNLWSNAYVFICVSESIRLKAIEAGFPQNKLRVVYNGIQCDSASDNGGDRDKNLILFIGRLVEKKGCVYLLRSMPAVRVACPGAKLVIIGDGPMRSELSDEAVRLGIPCEFLGARSRDFVRSYQRKARVVCAPSVTARNGDSEGLPTVILEALAAGAIVVGTEHAGIPEVISHGRTGLLAPQREPKLLADALIQALTDEQLGMRCRQQGYHVIREKFDIIQQTSRLEAIYDEVLQSA